MSPRAGLLVASVAASTVAAIAGAAGAAAPMRACTGANLRGSFAAIPGSGSAGHIGYRLTLQNKTRRRCVVKGLPKVRLLDRRGHSLPSHVVPAGGRGHAVVIAPGRTAVADARFSPDVPGAGDRSSGRCQPTAFKARVSPRPGGGKVVVPVTPHTSVCEKGTMSFHPFRPGP
jgi:hypothetical protein